MSSLGPNSPGTMANDDTVGTIDWASVDNAKVSDGNLVTAVSPSGIFHYLKATNFGFSVPNGSTINGIEVEIEEQGDGDENSVKIVKDGTIGGTEKSTAATLPDPEAYISYGDSTDLWGLSWTVGDINSSTFGVGFSVDNGAGEFAFVDHIRITVYHTVGGTPTLTGISSMQGLSTITF